MYAAVYAPGNLPILLDCAHRFSPLIEITSADLVTFDIRGLGRIYGPADRIAEELERVVGIPAQIAVAANPDTAIYAARGFSGPTLIPYGEEAKRLAPLSLHLLGCPTEVGEVLDLWGIRTFGEFSELPPLGVAARLGAEGSFWQQQAQGAIHRRLRLMNEPVRFSKQQEFEEPITNRESLLFVIGRFLYELCIELKARFFATNELRLQFHLESFPEHQVCIQIPAPLADPKALLTLLRLELEQRSPSAPILKLQLELIPTAPRTTQEELFAPAYPAPEQIELTLARVRRIVGSDNVGRPELLDTHRPDGFVMRPFVATARRRSDVSNSASLAFRRYRPPVPAQVRVEQRPVHVSCPFLRGPIRTTWGPWYASGDWWTQGQYDREEWDAALQNDTLFRIFREIRSSTWFVEGIYD